MSLVDICFEDGKLTGEVKSIAEAHECGDWHRVAHVWLYNSKGEILLQRRSNSVKTWKNLWGPSAAGHIDAGEDAILAIRREMVEEIGFAGSEVVEEFLDEYKAASDYEDHKVRHIISSYALFADVPVENFSLQAEEAAEVRWVGIKDFVNWVERSPEDFVPTIGGNKKIIEFVEGRIFGKVG